MSCEGKSQIGMEIPLSETKIVYQVVLDSSSDPDIVSSQMDEEDDVLMPIWDTSSYFSHDFLDDYLPSNEAILEAMNGSYRSWDDMNNYSYFLP
jgi:hypothetical protein